MTSSLRPHPRSLDTKLLRRSIETTYEFKLLVVKIVGKSGEFDNIEVSHQEKRLIEYIQTRKTSMDKEV